MLIMPAQHDFAVLGRHIAQDDVLAVSPLHLGMALQRVTRRAAHRNRTPASPSLTVACRSAPDQSANRFTTAGDQATTQPTLYRSQ